MPGWRSSGVLPTMDTIVLERFFDDAGGMQLVGHAPFGARLNRALGLALRKRFCVTFDFELQAAASDDAILLSLGPQHSFPLDRVPKFLASGTVEEVVRQAVLTSPMFAARWRWNLNTSLAVLRRRGGRKNPPAIQRMEADDLMAAVFPTLAACQENVAPGPLEIPDHLLVRQTLQDCLREAMDIDGLKELVAGIESGRVSVWSVTPPSRPCWRTRFSTAGRSPTWMTRRWKSAAAARCRCAAGCRSSLTSWARLDPAAIERVIEQVRPDPRDQHELHDLLMSLVATAAGRSLAAVVRGPRRRPSRRARCTPKPGVLWSAVERLPAMRALFPLAQPVPGHPVPGARRAAR